MGFECHYRDPAKRRAGANDAHGSPVEKRLEAMESLIQHLLNKSDQGQMPDTPWTDSVGLADTQMPETQLPGMLPYHTDSVDGMCAITFAGEYVPGYFGMNLLPSSH
jgi:hypothetical protein